MTKLLHWQTCETSGRVRLHGGGVVGQGTRGPARRRRGIPEALTILKSSLTVVLTVVLPITPASLDFPLLAISIDVVP